MSQIHIYVEKTELVNGDGLFGGEWPCLLVIKEGTNRSNERNNESINEHTVG